VPLVRPLLLSALEDEMHTTTVLTAWIGRLFTGCQKGTHRRSWRWSTRPARMDAALTEMFHNLP
jgi:hypothetical protein